ncbi:MAG: serine/threonine protein kinase, partial [Acidobacteriota bacterium]
AAGIIHRDLKPENVFVVRDREALGGERPKILDFGIAKLGDRAERGTTRTGQMMGTPAYMSPEQCNDSGRIDSRTDIYSLGCVLFHMLTGRPPFDHDGIGAIIAAHLREVAPPPSAIEPAVPAHVDPIVARCLAKRPDERFASMHELQQACDAVLGQLPAPPPTAPELVAAAAIERDSATTTLGNSVGESSRALTPVRVGLWAGIAAAAVAAGIVLAVTTTRHSGDAQPQPATPPPAEIAPAPIPDPPPPAPPAPPVATPTVDEPPPAPRDTPPPPSPAPQTTPAKKPPAKRPAAKKHPWTGDPYEDRT